MVANFYIKQKREMIIMSNNKNQFEVVYKPLTSPENAVAASVYIARARAAMAERSDVRKAAAPVFFSRTADGAGFAVRSQSREVLESLPFSFGSVVGHFGIFQRERVETAQIL